MVSRMFENLWDLLLPWVGERTCVRVGLGVPVSFPVRSFRVRRDEPFR